MAPQVLVTGGAGFIGSHVATALIEDGMDVTILDNFDNSDPDIADRIAAMGLARPRVVEGDVRDKATLDRVFAQGIDAVVHMAGKKAVGESVADPLMYYSFNVAGTLSLLQAMAQSATRRLVFSSSATVYGTPRSNPIREDAALEPASPYGRTKLMIEQMIGDLVVAEPSFAALSLRYFNPVAARPGGTIGEKPKGTPNNLFPYIAQSAAGLRGRVQVYGNDYPTPDGTGVRDYVHVVDLARGHVAAVRRLLNQPEAVGRHDAVNLGTGQGYSVLEALAAFSRACGREVPFDIVARRPGDIPACVADPAFALTLLGWRAELGLDDMCRDHWAYQERSLA